MNARRGTRDNRFCFVGNSLNELPTPFFIVSPFPHPRPAILRLRQRTLHLTRGQTSPFLDVFLRQPITISDGNRQNGRNSMLRSLIYTTSRRSSIRTSCKSLPPATNSLLD